MSVKEAVLPVEIDRAQTVRAAICREAGKYLGYPASSPSRGQEGMDPATGMHCLGFVSQVLQDAQVLPQRANGQVRAARGMGILYGKSQLVPFQAARPGDLIFNVSMDTEGMVFPAHVGIYLGNDMLIDSPGAHGSFVRRMRVSYKPYPYKTEGNILAPGMFYTMYRSVAQAPWHFQGQPL